MTDPLAPYAVRPEHSRGREFHEKPHPYRSPFERDRDRIIHSAAFRRLEGKTQVFAPGADDHYRTRLTHSIEVAQIGRTIARNLRLNEALTEAICLGHDLGHSPFGHTGETVLNKLMADCGGFEHNAQTLRIVDFLEHPYPDFHGLNLMYETRLAFARHHSPYDRPRQDQFRECNCTLEGQVADVADRIAYNCHDLEDGMRSRLIGEEQIKEIELVRQARDISKADSVDDYVVRRTRTAKAMIDYLVGDCIDTSARTIEACGVKTTADVCCLPQKLITLSQDATAGLAGLEKFLLDNLYCHDTLLETNKRVEEWMKRVFEGLCKDTARMPRYFQKMIPTEGLERIVCDYIAGMTDRYCLSMLEQKGK